MLPFRLLVTLSEPLSLKMEQSQTLTKNVQKSQSKKSDIERDMINIYQELSTEFFKPEIHQAVFHRIIDILKKVRGEKERRGRVIFRGGK